MDRQPNVKGAIPGVAGKHPERSCGECSMCCHRYPLEEIDKPKMTWCQHCSPGNGCKIYERRPQVCRDFACVWLRSDLAGHWFPKRSKIIVRDFAYKGTNLLIFNVDHRYPTRWREEPYFSEIKKIANEYNVVVSDGKYHYRIYPYGYISDPILLTEDAWKNPNARSQGRGAHSQASKTSSRPLKNWVAAS